ncbi:MAG: PD40 domain-containing protein [Phycisphaerales bacterium]|nr:PD40 domain-containing protein [Phycisphaerales bacterium]
MFARYRSTAALLACTLAAGCSKSNEPTHAAKPDAAPPAENVAANHEAAAPQEPTPPREGLIKTEKGWYDPQTHTITPFEGAAPADAPASNADWRAAEAGMLSDYVQLTDPAMFSRAGEAYFDPGMNWIIFQASPRAQMKEGEDAPYSMYVAKLQKETDDQGAERIVGLDTPIRVSAAGSHNTCGFFNPAEPWRIIFGSTIIEPIAPDAAGYQRGGSRYAWAFPSEMEVCTRVVQEIFDTYRPSPKLTTELDFLPSEYTAKPLFKHPGGYDAECAYSPDGRWIVFSSIDPETKDADLWITNTTTFERVRITNHPGYDGGPFFSPDGRRLCYRSDRQQNELLQVFVADLAFDSRGAITGISAEHQVTNNAHVNWAPYWHPSGEYMIYSTSEVGHDNYEIFAVQAPPSGIDTPTETLRAKRITNAPGFDGLSVFSNDGAYMMWTSQRGGVYGDDAKPSSQVWVARTGSNLAP